MQGEDVAKLIKTKKTKNDPVLSHPSHVVVQRKMGEEKVVKKTEWRPYFRRARGRPKTRWDEHKKTKNLQLVILVKGEEGKLEDLRGKSAKESSGSSLPKTDQLENPGKVARREHCVKAIKTQRLRWYGHVKRNDEEKIVKKVIKWKLNFARAKGRPKTRWEEHKKAKNPQLVILAKGEEEKLRRFERKIAQKSSGRSLSKTDELRATKNVARRRQRKL